jgi:hypothetical protein
MSESIKLGDQIGLPLGESLGCKLESSEGIALCLSLPAKLGFELGSTPGTSDYIILGIALDKGHKYYI